MTMFDRLPGTLQAVQWTGSNFDGLADWVGHQSLQYAGTGDGQLKLLCGPNGDQGWVPVPVGDWVAKGTDPPHFYPINNDYLTTHFTPQKEETT